MAESCDSLGLYAYADRHKIAAPDASAACGGGDSQQAAAAACPPSPSAAAAAPGPPCTCGRSGVCTACVLADLESDPFIRSLTMLDQAVTDAFAPPSNVTPLRRAV